MFKSLKEKLGGFFSKREKIEEKKEEVVEAKEKEKEPQKTKTDHTKVEGVSERVAAGDEKVKEKKSAKKEEIKKENKEELDHAIEQVENKTEEEQKLDIPKPGFLEKIRSKLGTTKLTQETFNEFFEELESLLLENNVALDVVDKIKEDMEADLVNLELKKDDIEEQIKTSLKNSLNNLLIEPFDILRKIRFKEDPYVILFFGINGVGKTTTIAKFANYLKEHKITTIIAAADTLLWH